MKKRLLSFSLCVCMLFTMLPMGTLVMADGAGVHSHPVCGASHSDIYGHTGECTDLEWKVWDGSDMDPDKDGVQLKAGNWYLEDDLVYPDVIYIVGDVNFCFNGHYIISTGTSTIFRSDDGYIEQTVAPGERIAQLVIAPVFTPAYEEVDELTDTDRGTGGFGSTGK